MSAKWETLMFSCFLNNAALGGAGAGPEINLPVSLSLNLEDNIRPVLLKSLWIGLNPGSVTNTSTLLEARASFSITTLTGPLKNSGINGRVSTSIGATPRFDGIIATAGFYSDRWEPTCPIENIRTITVSNLSIGLIRALQAGEQFNFYVYAIASLMPQKI